MGFRVWGLGSGLVRWGLKGFFSGFGVRMLKAHGFRASRGCRPGGLKIDPSDDLCHRLSGFRWLVFAGECDEIVVFRLFWGGRDLEFRLDLCSSVLRAVAFHPGS